MIRRPFSTSPSYLQYIQALRDLHALTLAGRDGSPEADAICNGMDQPWYDLSEIEQRRIKGLSEDLYSISDPPREPLPLNPQAQRKLDEATEAWLTGRWDHGLELLRRWGRYLDPAILSNRRGSLWRDAGDHSTAALFFQHAAQLDPTNGKHRYLYLMSIEKSDPDLAFIEACEVIAHDENHPPELVVTAASIVITSLQQEIGEAQGITPERLIPALERALTRLSDNGSDTSFSLHRSYVVANHVLAICYVLAGDLREAIRALDSAIAVEPDARDLIHFRGILRYGSEPGAADDFEKAIRLGSTATWPYFYLAHRALITDRYEECLRLCERALTFPASDEVRALLNEWLAISRAEQRYPSDQVRATFEEAMRLAPDAERTRLNLAAYETSVSNRTSPRADWIKPRASTVQAFGRSDFPPPSPSPLIAA